MGLRAPGAQWEPEALVYRSTVVKLRKALGSVFVFNFFFFFFL